MLLHSGQTAVHCHVLVLVQHVSKGLKVPDNDHVQSLGQSVRDECTAVVACILEIVDRGTEVIGHDVLEGTPIGCVKSALVVKVVL